MPIIYLSPSTQEWNPYVNGGNEEYYMNLIADAMEPYLRANGIEFTRNTPDMTAASSIRASNAGNYDLHLALHSNAAPAGREGQVRGSEVYYAAVSRNGKRAANIIANNLKLIYPDPSKVRALTTTNLGEVTKTRAPAVLIEFAYHDNLEDAQWIQNNIQEIAQNVVLSLTEYFGIPFVTESPIRYGKVQVSPESYLNIRSRPALDATVLRRAYNGETVAIVGEVDGWYVVESDDVVGYAYSDYIVMA